MSVRLWLRRQRRVVAVAAATVVVASTLSVAAQASVPRPRAAAQAMGTYTGYAVQRPVCGAPVPGQFTCMSYRSVDVPAGTPGAKKYTIPMWARGPAGGLTPKALASAYNYDPTARINKTVAIVDWFRAPNIHGDLAAYDRHYGLQPETANSFRVVNESGAASPLPAADPDSSVEISLDVEAVRAVCNHCRILLIEATNPTSASLARAENTAVRLGADVISNSFGAPERRGHPYPASFYKAFDHKGVVITASSGDNGWYFWDVANEDPFGYPSSGPQSASFPASMGSVVSVGGTRLTLATNGTRAGESVWNGNGVNDAGGNSRQEALGASGGGCSTQFAVPSWQAGIPGYQQAGCRGKRLSVDVSAVGDPATGLSVLDSYGLRGWARIGGTSLSSPVIAAMWALAGGARGLAYPARALYQNFRHRPGSIYDVQSGGNSWCGGATTADCSAASDSLLGVNNPNAGYDGYVDCSFPSAAAGQVHKIPTRNTECNAVRGYDGASGVGAPRNLRIFRSPAPTLTLTAAPRAHGARSTFAMHVTTNLDGSKITQRVWRFADTTGPHSASSDMITHTFARAGTYSVQATITDNVGQTASASVVVRIP